MQYMTEKEAIENYIKENEKCFKECEGACLYIVNGVCTCQDGLIISALKEIQQYRVIGTLEECRKAREKQIAKKPHIWGDGYDDKGNLIYDMYDCPCCGKSYEIDYEKYDFCPNCGQKMEKTDGNN